MSQYLLQDILQKMDIEKLNPMQEEALIHISSQTDVVLLSPTGTGKTLAFLLPLIEKLDVKQEVQLLILVPARELAIQIEQVIRKMGTGFKVNSVYGGHSHSKDKINFVEQNFTNSRKQYKENNKCLGATITIQGDC